MLTILGAMLYLRLGWMVGNNGLLGAILVILLAYSITGATALSLSSIATNTHVRPGGAFAIISGALGLEAGGAIGIPLYIAQAASSAMYLYAFTEGWAWFFPSHNPRIVVMLAFFGVAALVWSSASLASKAQAVMLGVVVVALACAFGGVFTTPLVRPQLVGRFTDASLLETFTIFFPAATGIMVGAGMSGNLVNARKSIPVGTLSAWAVTLSAYLIGAVWYANIATPSELVSTKTIMLDRKLVSVVVAVGLLASTLMAALSTLVAAPRLLQAMAQMDVVPGASWFSSVSPDGAPRSATIFTLVVAGLFLLTGSLDAIAPIITAFFVVTYLAINGVVVLEQSLGMISFRPTFAVPLTVPLFGLGACAVVLVATSPGAGFVELLFVGGIYAWLQGRQLDSPWETVESGIGVSIAAWVARRWGSAPRSERAWRPDLLVPVGSIQEVHRQLPLIRGITARNGSVKLVGIGRGATLSEELQEVRGELEAHGHYATSAVVRASTWRSGVASAIDALQGALFPPNVVLVEAKGREQKDIQLVIDRCSALQVGLILGIGDEGSNLASAQEINVWVSSRGPEWSLGLHLANLDLPVLIAWLLCQHGESRLSLSTTVADVADVAPAKAFLAAVVEEARLPVGTGERVSAGNFFDALENAPTADLHLIGLPEKVDLERLRDIQRRAGAPCLFLRDSGMESLLA
ncbi:MAG: hypothetical protein GWP91_09580 [Rhodobacterales bacterium]|nr:hypothetical protein [Rhodobacterales bacterium]